MISKGVLEIPWGYRFSNTLWDFQWGYPISSWRSGVVVLEEQDMEEEGKLIEEQVVVLKEQAYY